MKTIFVKALFITVACFTFLCLSSASISNSQILKKSIKGEGPVIEKKIEIGDISGVALAISADVFLTQGTNREVRVKGQENIIDNLDLTVESLVLKIGNKQNVKQSEDLEIYITLPAIDLIRISGSGDIRMVNHFSNLKDLKINISGSGDISTDLDGEKIVAGISGSGNITLAGKAAFLDLSVSGSGNINAKKLEVQDSEISVTGSGNANVNVSGSIEGHLSGSGNIGYLGNPKTHLHKTGSGSIKPIVH